MESSNYTSPDFVIQVPDSLYVMDSMEMGRTTSMPKSALRYELDIYPDLETCSIPVLFFQN